MNAVLDSSVAAVVASIISSIIVMWHTSRSIIITNITQERKKWRDQIRKMSEEVVLAFQENDAKKVEILAFKFAVRLNPLDDEDRKIISDLDKLFKELMRSAEDGQKSDGVKVESDLSAKLIQSFRDRLALLLKHDWEKAKDEAIPFPVRYIWRIKWCQCDPCQKLKRVAYHKWKRRVSSSE